MAHASCFVCQGPEPDADLSREQVWEDDLWRLTTSVGPGEPIPGFSYLEPKRHIPFITDLDGEETRTLGPILSRCIAALKEAGRVEGQQGQQGQLRARTVPAAAPVRRVSEGTEAGC